MKTVPWKNVALFLVTLAVLVLCLFVLRAFLAAIAGAVVLAVATRWPYRWLRCRIKNSTVAATTGLSIVVVGVVLPALFLARLVSQYALTIVVMLRNGTFEATVLDAIERHSQLAAILQQSSGFVVWSSLMERVGVFVASKTVVLFSSSIAAVVQVIIMLFLLFFLYRDGESAVRVLYSLLPMEEEEARLLLTGIDETIHATFLGHLAVAAVQGIVAGIAFLVLGVSNAVMLGVFTAVTAIIPSFGAYIVWLPVAIYLGLNGHWLQAILLAAVGTLIISTLDNFLYPMLVGAQLRQHTAIILLAMLGGIWLFGISGFVLGPILFSVAISLLEIWRGRSSAGIEAG